MTAGCEQLDNDRQHVVVTGAAGLTGAALCRELAGTYAVHALSRRPLTSTRSASTGSEDVCWHEVDLSTAGFVERLPPRADHVVHLAQSRRFREFPEEAEDIFAINVAAAAHLLDYARRVGCSNVVLASTGSVYRASSLPLREDDSVDISGAAGYYAASKLASEMLAGAYAKEFRGLTVLRPFFLYGPGQEQGMLIPRLINTVRDGKPVSLAGQDGFRFTPTFVSDSVAAVTAGLGVRGSHVINIGGPEVLSLREVCVEIGHVVDREPIFEITDAKAGDFLPDLTRMSTLLAEPQVRFSDGVRRVVQHVTSDPTSVGTAVDGGL